MLTVNGAADPRRSLQGEKCQTPGGFLWLPGSCGAKGQDGRANSFPSPSGEITGDLRLRAAFCRLQQGTYSWSCPTPSSQELS